MSEHAPSRAPGRLSRNVRPAAFGIAARLYVSLLVLAGMTLVASIVAWIAFDAIGRSVEQAADVAERDMVSALDLARLGAEISSIAPGIAASTTDAARARENALLDKRRQQIAAAIDALAARGLGKARVSALGEISSALGIRLADLNRAVLLRLETAATRGAALDDLSHDLSRFSETLEPLVDDAVFDLVIGGERVSDESAAAISDLVDGAIERVDALLSVSAEGNLAFGLLTRALATGDANMLRPLEERFVAAAAAIDRNLAALPDDPSLAPLRSAAGDLVGLGRGDRSLFDRVDGALHDGADANVAVLQARVDDAHDRLQRALAPLVDDAAFDLVLSTEGAADDAATAIADLIGGGADTLYLLLRIQAEGHLAAGLLNQAAGTTDPRQLRPLRERFDTARIHIDESVAQLASPEMRSAILAVATPLLAHADGEDDIVALRERELGHIADADAALAASQNLSGALNVQVSGLVDAARDTSAAAAANTRSTIDTGRQRLAAIVIAVLVVSAFVMLVYVRRNIVRPLGRITSSMAQLAEGDATVDIPYRDRRDEIGDMAHALGVFRDTALEVQRSNLRELQTARRRLADAIESISEAFSLYDAHDRLVIFNSKYKTLLYPGMEEAIEIGSTFEAIVRRAAEGGYIRDAQGDVDGWVAERMARYRNPGEPHVQQRADGRWIMVSERKTGEGGTVAVYSDITELKLREEELTEKSTALEQLSGQLAKYLAPQVYESIFTGRQEVTLNSRRKKLTVFFSDIVNFTGTADLMESEDLTLLLNRYLTEMSEIALEHGATIDKYVGDAIVIFFGDPESRGVKEDALACARMAVAMQRRMHELQQVWRDAGIENPLRIRMGINTGFCTVGNFGSEHRMDYTIIGGGVNLASRLETSALPGEILVSYETYALIRNDLACEPRGEITVKGINHPVSTFAVTEAHEQAPGRIREEHAHLRLDLHADVMTQEERAAAAQALRVALETLAEQDEAKDA